MAKFFQFARQLNAIKRGADLSIDQKLVLRKQIVAFEPFHVGLELRSRRPLMGLDFAQEAPLSQTTDDGVSIRDASITPWSWQTRKDLKQEFLIDL